MLATKKDSKLNRTIGSKVHRKVLPEVTKKVNGNEVGGIGAYLLLLNLNSMS